MSAAKVAGFLVLLIAGVIAALLGVACHFSVGWSSSTSGQVGSRKERLAFLIGGAAGCFLGLWIIVWVVQQLWRMAQ